MLTDILVFIVLLPFGLFPAIWFGWKLRNCFWADYAQESKYPEMRSWRPERPEHALFGLLPRT